VLRCGYGFEGWTPTRDSLVMLKNVFGHAMPRGLPLCGEVVSAPRFIAYTIGMGNAFRNRNQGRRDIACSRRRAVLVGDDCHLVTFASEVEHRSEKIMAVACVNPAGP